MAGNKYIYNNGGTLTEKAALQASAGAGSAANIVALDSTGRLDVTMMPVGFGAENDLIVASEALAAGDLVNIWTNTGVANVRKADGSTAGKEAHGFVIAAFDSLAIATVYRSTQVNTQKTGMTPGARQYLSATVPGGTQETAPTAAGQTVQVVGHSKSATELIFNPLEPIVLA